MQGDGLHDRFTKWLGSVDARLYRGSLCVAAVAVFFLGHVLAVRPIWQHIFEARELTARLVEYAAHKEELLAQLRHSGFDSRLRVATVHAGGTPPTSSLILEGIHSRASQAGVVITDFTNGATVSADHLGNQMGVRFSAQGTFAQIRQLIHLLSSHEAGLIIVEMVIENMRWPDFTGELRLSVGGIARLDE